MALQTNLDLTLRANLTNAIDLETASSPLSLDLSDELTTGTGAIDTADKKFSDRRTLAATTENIDLAGSLVDAFGNTITFARIKCIVIRNRSVTPGENLIIGGAASNTFLLFADATDKDSIGPGGIRLYWEPSAAAKPVTASTGDILKVDSGAATITYDIVIIGSSA